MEYRLPIHLNRGDVHAIEVATATFEAPGTFAVEVTNHGQPVHVHLQLDDALSRAASISANNHFVEADDIRTVTVRAETDRRPVQGKLKIVTGHGGASKYVDVRLVEGPGETPPVEVEPPTGGGRRPRRPAPPVASRENAPVAVLAVVALLVALGVLTRTRGLAVLVGAAAVLFGIAVAFYVLVS